MTLFISRYLPTDPVARLLERLWGEVYQATDTRLDRTVATNVLLPEHAASVGCVIARR